MKLYQNSFNENSYYITPSDMIEFQYCKRFIYFMKCLGIQQYEEKRYKVQKGRIIHANKEKQNRDYLRKKLKIVEKRINVSLVSEKYKISGIVDEVVTLEDGTMAPLDYKFAKFDGKIYNTYKLQMIMYSLMIREVFNKDVNKAFLIYCRDGNTIKTIDITPDAIKKLIKQIHEYEEVIEGYYPNATRYKSRCFDCCYKNICIK